MEILDSLVLISQVIEAETNEEMRLYLQTDEGENLLNATGYRKPVSSTTTKDKESIVSALVDYHLLIKVKAEMDQLKTGLASLGFLQELQSNPKLWEPYFMAVQDPLNAGNFYRVIVCIVDILSDIIVCLALIVVTAEWCWFSLSVNIINCYLNCCGLACNSYYCLCLVYIM